MNDFEDKILEFERKSGSLAFIKACVSVINKTLVDKGIITQKQLQEKLLKEISVKQTKKIPFLCKIGLHSWKNIKEPKNTIPVGRIEPGFTDSYPLFVRIHNRACTKCPKKDMVADRMRNELKTRKNK